MPIKVAPRGFPSCRSLACGDAGDWKSGAFDSEVFRRNSWVMAMPMLANESDVRSQARNVRSTCRQLTLT